MIQNRDELVQGLRPKINADTERASAHEKYQGETLRPLLKFQNEFILRSFGNYLQEKKVLWKEMKEETKLEFIHTVLKKDQSYKQLLIGCIIGLLSAAELEVYFGNKAEVNKRITELAIKRISDQVGVINYQL